MTVLVSKHICVETQPLTPASSEQLLLLDQRRGRARRCGIERVTVGIAAEADAVQAGVGVEQGAHQGGGVEVRAVRLGGVAADDEHVA